MSQRLCWQFALRFALGYDKNPLSLSLASCPTSDSYNDNENDNDSHKQFHSSTTIASGSCCAVYRESFPANFSVRVHSLIWLGWVHFECACTRLHSEKRLGFVLCCAVPADVNEPNEAPSKLVETTTTATAAHYIVFLAQLQRA